MCLTTHRALSSSSPPPYGVTSSPIPATSYRSLPAVHNHITMRLSGSGAVLSLLPLFLGLFSLVVAAPSDSSHNGKRCVKPQVRREWRALSKKEKTEWISAVKVSLH